MKRLHIFVVAFVLLCLGFITFVTLNVRDQALLYIAGRQYRFEVATTALTRGKGLSGRTSLPADHVMLFVFDKPGISCFWMKDMRFPLDIIWLDGQKKVVYIEQNLNPDTYPTSFCPDKASLYTVEINAGISQRIGLKVGDQISF